MLETYKIITVTHKRINLREIAQFVVQTPEATSLRERLTELKEQFGFRELLYMATCNRVVYFFVTDTPLTEELASRFLLAVNPHLSNTVLDHIGDHASLLEGMDAVNHLYEVAGAIDSLVVGEHQILGQLREAYEQCRDWALTGDSLRLAVQNAIIAAKGVYSKTRIGDKPVSIVSLAFQQMLRAHVARDARILVIGAGQTNQLVGKFLTKYEFSNVHIFNRTLDRARELAAATGASAHIISDLDTYSEGFDCLIVCTGAVDPIINPARYARLLQGETGRKVIIDLAIPHNVDHAVTEQFDVHYIEIEGLRLLAKENLAFREQEVKHARQLLNEYLREFPSLYKQRQLELALRSVPVEIKAVKDRTINEVFRQEVDQLDDSTRDLVVRMLSYMEKKCIGIPMKAAREVLIK